ncbi:hypothetical protein ELOC111193_09870 [Elizabethkingia occulta]
MSLYALLVCGEINIVTKNDFQKYLSNKIINETIILFK